VIQEKGTDQAGQKGFSAGAEIGDHAPERVNKMLAAFHMIFRQLSRADCITIASVHGHCLGGGMELATFCDFVIAGESAMFGQPEIKLGCFPPIAMIMLPALCGLRHAMSLILTGRTISSQEALRLGLVSRIESDEELRASVEKFVAEMTQLSPAVLKLTKQVLRKTHFDEFEERLSEIERVYFDELMCNRDALEGIQAFMEKRAPKWRPT
jgi:cyclohexa-1,5-dienecarbonyl-CoA hydratase